MRILLIFLLPLACTQLTAQNLIVKCPRIKSGKVYVINQSNKSIDSLGIVNERFTFKSKFSEPSLFTLRSSAFSTEVYLVLERNKLLSIEIDSVGKVKYYVNTPTNSSFQLVHGEYINFQHEILRLSPMIDSLDNDSLMNLRQKTYRQYIHRVSDFLYQKSDNILSVIVLFEIIHQSMLLPADELKKCFEVLSSAVKKSSYGRKISEYLKKELTLREGNIAPAFELVDVENKVHRLSDYKGRYVLLHFWASWCGPCRNENKKWPAMLPTIGQLPLTIIHISQDSEKKAWLKAIKEDKLERFIHVLTTKGEKNNVFYNYQISGIPDMVLIGPEGTIKRKGISWMELEKHVK